MSLEATIEIAEEPASNLMRFRYLSEGVHGSLLGKSSKSERRTYPAIKIMNYTGNASVRVSCVTKDAPHKSHPHNLVGQNCSRGVCNITDFTTNSDAPAILYFPNMSIQCAKIKEIEANLNDRQAQRIDPFGNGFEDRQELRRSLKCVRLCFEVIIRPDPMNPTHEIHLIPKVSQPIYNMKIPTEIIINDISDTSSPKCGGKKIMIFCNKISKEDIGVRFFRERGENVIWEEWGTNLKVHKNFAIAFMTPKFQYQYQDDQDDYIVNVFLQLVRLDVKSTPIPFQYTPDVTNIDAMMKRKKCKIGGSEELFEHISGMRNSNIPSTSQHRQHYLQQNQPEYQIFPENNEPQEQFTQQQQPIQCQPVSHQPMQHQHAVQHQSVQHQLIKNQPVHNQSVQLHQELLPPLISQECFPPQQQLQPEQQLQQFSREIEHPVGNKFIDEFLNLLESLN